MGARSHPGSLCTCRFALRSRDGLIGGVTAARSPRDFVTVGDQRIGSGIDINIGDGSRRVLVEHVTPPRTALGGVDRNVRWSDTRLM